MSRMSDEKYLYVQDVKEKKTTARSASKKRGHCGKGGRVKFPSDYMTKGQLEKMNGKCKSYRLNSPMNWSQFMEMPEDLRCGYIKLLREKYNMPDKVLAEMFGVSSTMVSKTFKKLGLVKGSSCDRPKSWNKEGFVKWSGITLSGQERVVEDGRNLSKGPITFEGELDDIFRAISAVIHNDYVRMTIDWEVVENVERCQ